MLTPDLQERSITHISENLLDYVHLYIQLIYFCWFVLPCLVGRLSFSKSFLDYAFDQQISWNNFNFFSLISIFTLFLVCLYITPNLLQGFLQQLLS